LIARSFLQRSGPTPPHRAGAREGSQSTLQELG
jgi:hypothetical protein